MRKIGILWTATLLVAVLAGEESPLERFRAVDIPLNYKGATGVLAERLRFFDVPPQSFDYTMQLLREDERVQVFQVRFPSPFVSDWPENNIVPAEFYLPQLRHEKLPAAVVLDILDGRGILPRIFARALAEQGIAAFYFSMAYYNQRRPHDHSHLEALRKNPARLTEALRQTVLDARRARALLAAHPEVDAARIGITGISLGGIVCALVAGVDGEFARVVPLLSGGDLAWLIFETRETRLLRSAIEVSGMTRERFAELIAPVEPLHFGSRILPQHCLMINASEDEVIPREATEALHRAMGEPTLLWVPRGHYSAVTYLPIVLVKTAEFFQGKEVKTLSLLGSSSAP